MPKKVTKKRGVSHVHHHTESHEESHESRVNKAVLENFVSLQKVMTNFVVKMDSLTTQISKLLELFEISAKALAEKDFEIEKDNQEMLEKLDTLIDQNKILAKGLTLMHERIPREFPTMPPPQPPMFQQKDNSFREINPSSQGFQPSMAQKPMAKEITDFRAESPPTKPVFEPPI